MPWGVFQPPRLTRYAASLRTSPDTGCFQARSPPCVALCGEPFGIEVATSTGLVGNLEAERPDHERPRQRLRGRCAGGNGPVPTATEHYFYRTRWSFWAAPLASEMPSLTWRSVQLSTLRYAGPKRTARCLARKVRQEPQLGLAAMTMQRYGRGKPHASADSAGGLAEVTLRAGHLLVPQGDRRAGTWLGQRCGTLSGPDPVKEELPKNFHEDHQHHLLGAGI